MRFVSFVLFCLAVFLGSCDSGGGRVIPSNGNLVNLLQAPSSSPQNGSQKNYVDFVIKLDFGGQNLEPATVIPGNFQVFEDPGGTNTLVQTTVTQTNPSTVEIVLATDQNQQMNGTNYKFNTEYRLEIDGVESVPPNPKTMTAPFTYDFKTADIKVPVTQDAAVAVNECYPYIRTGGQNPGFDSNGDGTLDTGDEFVEVVNRTDDYQNLRGFALVELPADANDPNQSAAGALPTVYHAFPDPANDEAGAIPPRGAVVIWRGTPPQNPNIGHSLARQASAGFDTFANYGSVNSGAGSGIPVVGGVSDLVALVDIRQPNNPIVFDVLLYLLTQPNTTNNPPPENSYNSQNDGGNPNNQGFNIAGSRHVAHRRVQGANPNAIASPGTKVDGSLWE